MSKVTLKPLESFRKRPQPPSRPRRKADTCFNTPTIDSDTDSRPLGGGFFTWVTQKTQFNQHYNEEGKTGLANRDGKNFPGEKYLPPDGLKGVESTQAIDCIYALHTQSIRNHVRNPADVNLWCLFYAGLLVVPWAKIGAGLDRFRHQLALELGHYATHLQHRNKHFKAAKWEYRAIKECELERDPYRPADWFDASWDELLMEDASDLAIEAQEAAKQQAKAAQNRAWAGLPEPQGGEWAIDSPMRHNNLAADPEGYREEKWTPWHIYMGPVPLTIPEFSAGALFRGGMRVAGFFREDADGVRRVSLSTNIKGTSHNIRPYVGSTWSLPVVRRDESLYDYMLRVEGWLARRLRLGDRCGRWFRLENRIGEVGLGDYLEPWE